MNFLYSIILSIQDIAKNDIQKKSIINGSIWLILWLLIIFFTWNHMTSLTQKLLSWIPFAFIKYSGSYLILTILWIQTILITLGIIFYIFNKVIEKYLEKTHSHYFTLIMGAIIVLFYTFLFFYYKNSFLLYISHFIKILPFQSVEELISIFLAILFYYMLFSVSISLTFTFMGINILKNLSYEQYPDIKLKKIKRSKILYCSLRDLFIFIILSLICYPLLLIPWINIFTMLFLWAYAIKDTYFNSVKDLLNLNDLNKKEKYLLAFFSAVLNFIPLINIYTPAFGLLLFYHYMAEKKEI